jgi:peptide/nickel transport system permease protein
VFRHILPNVISVIIVSATLDFATSMLTEATLSYLGFGVQAPQPTWGNMLYGANDSKVIQNYWWRWVFASIILGVCVICINLVGDGLRDAIDPKSQER